MSKIILSIYIYIIAILYFYISKKIMYVYTIKYYSLFRYVSEDKQALILLNKSVLKYRTLIRYLRIHVIMSSILATINIVIQINLIMSIIKLSMLFLIVFETIDLLSLKHRCISLEDKVYRIHNNILL